MAELRILAHDLKFPEGPVAMDDGSVILGEIAGGTVTRITPDGKVDRFSKPAAGRTGWRSAPTARSIAATTAATATRMAASISTGRSEDYVGGSIQRIDPRSGEATHAVHPLRPLPAVGAERHRVRH